MTRTGSQHLKTTLSTPYQLLELVKTSTTLIKAPQSVVLSRSYGVFYFLAKNSQKAQKGSDRSGKFESIGIPASSMITGPGIDYA